MICQQCKEEGLKNTVRVFLEYETISNTTRINYECSNGHAFQKESYNRCHCGWTNDPSIENKK